MKFGIFFELSTPRPFTTAAEWSVYHNALEQCRLADELGFDHVWAVEHHFLEEYSHCSSPEVFLTAVAAQTQRIRVGHGAVVCVPEMNHPIRVAERRRALTSSNGRLLRHRALFHVDRTRRLSVNPDDTKRRGRLVRVLPQMDEGRIRVQAGVRCRRVCCPNFINSRIRRVTVTTPGTNSTRRDRTRLLGVSAGRLRRAGAAHEGVSPPRIAQRAGLPSSTIATR